MVLTFDVHGIRDGSCRAECWIMEATISRADPKRAPASRSTQAPSALTVGYNGANNTGAEALLATDIADLRAVLGPRVRITVPTLNAANLRRYVQEGDGLRRPREDGANHDTVRAGAPAGTRAVTGPGSVKAAQMPSA